jgi:ubiquinone/menaquinone biosynthesis C-methylase UbiE
MRECPDVGMSNRSVARTFDKTAEIYERARPSWPSEALDHVIKELRVDRTAIVLDLGAGTGKLTRMLVNRFDNAVAVEPLDGMRTLLASLISEVETYAGDAENIPLGDASVDVVFSADAFHWFDGELALAEIARVLRPRGGLVLMWNEPAKPTQPSIAAAGALLNERGSSERQINRYASGAWREPFAGSSFEELSQAQFDHQQVVDREQLLAYFASMSWIAVLPDEERAELLSKVRELLDADSYTRFWRADLYWTRLAALIRPD